MFLAFLVSPSFSLAVKGHTKQAHDRSERIKIVAPSVPNMHKYPAKQNIKMSPCYVKVNTTIVLCSVALTLILSSNGNDLPHWVGWSWSVSRWELSKQQGMIDVSEPVHLLGVSPFCVCLCYMYVSKCVCLCVRSKSSPNRRLRVPSLHRKFGS